MTTYYEYIPKTIPLSILKTKNSHRGNFLREQRVTMKGERISSPVSHLFHSSALSYAPVMLGRALGEAVTAPTLTIPISLYQFSQTKKIPVFFNSISRLNNSDTRRN